MNVNRTLVLEIAVLVTMASVVTYANARVNFLDHSRGRYATHLLTKMVRYLIVHVENARIE